MGLAEPVRKEEVSGQTVPGVQELQTAATARGIPLGDGKLTCVRICLNVKSVTLATMLETVKEVDDIICRHTAWKSLKRLLGNPECLWEDCWW